MSICLNMIVKNEAGNLERLFHTLVGWVDYFVIADTGSSDQTIETIMSLSEALHIPGEVVRHEWVDFAHNRNMVMDAALESRRQGRHQASWLLIIDADEELLVNDPSWKKNMVPGISYLGHVVTAGLAFRRLMLPAIDGQYWRWKGEVHNYLQAVDASPELQFLEGVSIGYAEMGGSKSKAFQSAEQKYRHDISVLLRELDGMKPAPENVHRFFQLAYLYQAVQEPLTAANWYQEVWQAAGTPPHIGYVAALMAGKQFHLAGNLEASARCLEQAGILDQSRPEHLFYQAMAAKKLGKEQEMYILLQEAAARTTGPRDHWMLEHALYTWRIQYELCWWHVRAGHLAEAISGVDKLLQIASVPAAERQILVQLRNRLAGKQQAW